MPHVTLPSDLSFIDKAPFTFDNEITVMASPERVFQIFASGEGQEEWFQDFVAVTWHNPQPHGVGTTRDVKLKLLSVNERFLVWEPGQRLSFSIDSITLPILRQMMEDLQFSPVDGGCLLRWRVYYTPTPLMRMVHPLARMIFGNMFKASLVGLKAYAEAHPNIR